MSAHAPASRPSLRLVQPDAQASVHFCGRCGERFTEPPFTPMSRVCPSCSLGVLLSTGESVAPGPDDAFLIVDSSLAVQAVSERAEAALGLREELAVNRHITEVLIPGDDEAATAGSLAVAITRAAGGAQNGARVAVRPSNTFGRRMFARIAACGSPRAGLVVLG